MRIKLTNNDLKSNKNEFAAKIIYYKCGNFGHYKEFRKCSQYEKSDETRKQNVNKRKVKV